MARLRLPGNTSSERSKVLLSAIQEALGNVSGDSMPTSTAESVVGSLVSAAESKSWCCHPKRPDSIRDVLLRFLDQRVTIVTPFDTVTGTLIAVKRDYVVLVDSTSHLVLIPIFNIESVTPA